MAMGLLLSVQWKPIGMMHALEMELKSAVDDLVFMERHICE